MRMWIVKEIRKDGVVFNTASNKARDDIEKILRRMGFKTIKITIKDNERTQSGFFDKAIYHFSIIKLWKHKLRNVKRNDVVVFQLPIRNHSIWLSRFIAELNNQGVKTIAAIHDLDSIRIAYADDVTFVSKIRMKVEEIQSLKKFSYIIVHNKSMKKFMNEKYKIPNKKMIELKVFDYLIDDSKKLIDRTKERRTYSCIIAGNLDKEKAGYVYKLPLDCRFELYGPYYTEKNKNANIHYHGEFTPDEIPYVIKGDFGLIWDGDSVNTCEGLYGKYLSINNPHKTSLYLACGIPVIVWERSAIADFIKTNDCGIAIKSLNDIHKVLSEMSDDCYKEIVKNAIRVSSLLRAGYFTKNAINKIISLR